MKTVTVTLASLITVLESHPQWLAIEIESTKGGMKALIEDLISITFNTSISEKEPSLNEIVFENGTDSITITGYFTEGTQVFLDEDDLKQLDSTKVKDTVSFVLVDEKSVFNYHIKLINLYNDVK